MLLDWGDTSPFSLRMFELMFVPLSYSVYRREGRRMCAFRRREAMLVVGKFPGKSIPGCAEVLRSSRKRNFEIYYSCQVVHFCMYMVLK